MSKIIPSPISATLLALGDSYTIGEAVRENDRWPQQLARALEQHAIQLQLNIIAATGWTTDELSSTLQNAAFTPPYDMVSLMIGVNNQYRGYPIADFEIGFQNLLQQAIALAGDLPTHVMVLSIPDWAYTPFAASQNKEQISREIDQYNRIIMQISSEHGVHFIDITPISRLASHNPGLIATDTLHPSGEMYALWVEQILPIALKILAPTD